MRQKNFSYVAAAHVCRPLQGSHSPTDFCLEIGPSTHEQFRKLTIILLRGPVEWRLVISAFGINQSGINREKLPDFSYVSAFGCLQHLLGIYQVADFTLQDWPPIPERISRDLKLFLHHHRLDLVQRNELGGINAGVA